LYPRSIHRHRPGLGTGRAGVERAAQAGGPLARFAPLVTHRLPARPAAIGFTSEGSTRKLSIAGITEITVQGVAGFNGEQVWLDNVGHFASKRLAAAKGTTSHFKDQGLNFDNSGRNGHFSEIHWSNA
jgi:hypothetical protein